MTEEEWLAGSDPIPMVAFIGERTSERKLRLFTVACCRHVGHLITDRQCQQLLDLTERCADDLVGLSSELRSLREAVLTAFYGDPGMYVPDDPIHLTISSQRPEGYAQHAVLLAAYGHGTRAGEYLVRAATCLRNRSMAPTLGPDALREYRSAIRAVRHEEALHQANILRDIVGNPFRRELVSRTSLSHTVVTLAQTIYDEHAYERVAILADALEECGCTNQAILEHCRTRGTHVRGCWVVDLVLART